MQVSNRLQGLTGGGSDGWGIVYAARRMAASGRAVADLTVGEPDIRTQDVILEAMHKAARAGHTGYSDIPGIAGLRADVARRVQERTGVPTTVENVLITPGGQSALFSAHMAVLDPGERALFIDPFYATYPGTIRGASGVPVAVQAQAEDGFQPRAQALSAEASGAKSLLINSPNNPTGVIYSRTTLDGIAETCLAHDLWLISDEVYETQVWAGTHISPRSLPEMAPRSLVIGSMSKSHAMTGSRLGWLVGPAEVIAHAANLATHTTFGVPGYIQDAARFALAQGPDLEEAIFAPFRDRRQIVLDLLSQQNLVGVVPADGAMYVMLDIRGTGLSGDDFAQQLLETEAIAVMPGESFGRAAQGHVRMALTLPDAALREAFARVLAFAATRAQAA